MAIYLIAFAVFLWWFVRRYKAYEMPMEYPASFECGKKYWKPGTVICTVLLVLGAVITMFYSVTSDNDNLFELILGLFAVVCAISFTSFVNGTKGKNPRNGGFAGIIIVLFFCYRLIASYKEFAADPVVWHFAIQLIAISACLLAFYYVAGFAYKSPKMLPTLFFCHLGAFLAITSCADDVSIGEDLIAVATAGMLLLVSYAQLNNMRLPDETTESEN